MKKALLGVVVLVILLGVSTLSITQPEKGTRLRPHAPIYIDGNDAFTPENGVVSGSGTEEDPYIIEGWRIQESQGPAIKIRETNAHFIIRSCEVAEAKASGIVFFKVRNGRVEGCWISDSPGNSGIVLIESYDNRILGNALRRLKNGILLSGSQNNLVARNSTELTEHHGIALFTSDDNVLEGNATFSSSGHGIKLFGASNNILAWNEARSNWIGIEVRDLDGQRVFSIRNIILGNSSSDNIADGIRLLHAMDTVVAHNFISNNHEVGIRLYESSGSSIYHNNLLGNALNASDFEANENHWDNGSEGNYWNDYSGWDSDGDGISDFPYRIEGGGIDRYPLMRPWKPSVVAMGIKFTGPDEFVTVRNWGEEEVDLTGWQLQSLDLQTREVQHSFLFPDGCILPAEGRLRVHSGPEAAGRDNELCGATELDLYQGWQDIEEGAIVWDDVGGVVRLINDRGEVVDEYEYHWWRGG